MWKFRILGLASMVTAGATAWAAAADEVADFYRGKICAFARGIAFKIAGN